ncbi:MAG: cell division protein ZapA [Lachnospiraceae bacterium]|jgi:cell division protein ZapA|nr:cell division protein ZapA [Lachnospiraceae bacterium]MBQ1472677.1 cell division protein ZapA [Lachnospiraceae bacterium]MBQ1608510.1 cell division protein ZapA [Lachnospiraceae bacterium]MBQ1720786.1 cell division protein ZapA [Lachnospiraceae bacterium]MBQ2317457.1 cell division protein ZapA [Lachnospiraceae bacterium]
MSAKKSAEVLIGGKVYTLSGYEEEEYLQKVAAYINNKISEFDSMEEFRIFPADMKATLVELNIADDYFKAKALVDKYESDMELRDKELYDLKHDLISDQVRVEALEEQVRNLENEKKDLLLAKAKLEASLEETLLGSLKGSDEASGF